MPRLTFGDDHSAGSALAWEWIVHQTWPNWTLDIISVQDPGPPNPDSPLGYEPLREIHPAASLDLPASAGFAEVRYLTAHHDPRVVLGTCPDSTLLVVGPRGKGLLKTLRIGSTAEWLMQCPSTPLIIARAGAAVTRLVVAVDGSTHADAAVQLLATLPLIHGAHVAVVGIVEEENEIRAKVSEAAHHLAAANASVNAILIEPDAHMGRSNPRSALVGVIDREQPDLVVMGTKGLTGLTRVRVGSVASAVTHQVDCSVMLVRDTGADEGA